MKRAPFFIYAPLERQSLTSLALALLAARAWAA